MNDSIPQKTDWRKRDTCSVCGRNIRNTSFHLASFEEKDTEKHYFYSIEAKERREGK